MRPRIVVIDNYDSFTFNLVQQLGELGARVEVFRNDAITVAELRARRPVGVLLSPGPGAPSEAGITLEVIAALGGNVPLLGVCLGHQAIGQAFGAKVVRSPRVVHGKASDAFHRQSGVFAGLPSPVEVGRYHSLVVEPQSLPRCLQVTARTAEGEIMGLRHRTLEIEGVQFHPESILTPSGKAMLLTWLQRLPAGRRRRAA
jgi:anthranilate synthase/aminodeoxychorismate synthase-like glutamine amidotransferase